MSNKHLDYKDMRTLLAVLEVLSSNRLDISMRLPGKSNWRIYAQGTQIQCESFPPFDPIRKSEAILIKVPGIQVPLAISQEEDASFYIKDKVVYVEQYPMSSRAAGKMGLRFAVSHSTRSLVGRL